MRAFDPLAYGPTIAPLLGAAPLCEIGPGVAHAPARNHLGALTLQALAAPRAVADRDMAQCCFAALWLRFDYLEQGHTISQSIATTEGSYWHAIVHRREPDFDNAKYWFRRVGRHEIFEPLCEAARRLAGEHKTEPAADFLLRQSEWDPYQFVDLCDVALDGCPPIHTLCKRIQQCEWELLFDHCYRRAVAAEPAACA